MKQHFFVQSRNKNKDCTVNNTNNNNTGYR